MALNVFLGWDDDEKEACEVAGYSLRATSASAIKLHHLNYHGLERRGLYRRPTTGRDGQLWDAISEAPMTTSHAIARFFVPSEMGHQGWALFTDGDVLFRDDVAKLFALADPEKAVMVVQHDYTPTETLKKGGLTQTVYPRKNWSSVILWNCAHTAHRKLLTYDALNTRPGRELHRFFWLRDDQIGALPPEWNWLVGHSDPALDPAIVHFTNGLPTKPGYESQPYASEWNITARYASSSWKRPA